MSSEVLASVVIPTHNRRESLLRTLRALGAQTLAPDRFEVVVAVDRSTDGTQEALARLFTAYRLTSVSPAGRGRAAACNTGARAARGGLLVFLDDDMEPTPQFLENHLREHPAGSRRGLVGAVPVTLDAGSPPVVAYIGEKFNRHLERLARSGYRMTFRDFYSGNFSIRRDLFLEAGAFDEEFRIYGNEDGELALRLRQAGVDILYGPDAAARQHYEKDFAALARDNVAKGRTAVLLSRKWPDARSELAFARRTGSRKWRAVLSGLLFASKVAPFVPGLVVRAVTWIEARRPRRLDLLYRFALDYFYRLGARAELAEDAAAHGPSRPAGQTAPRTVVHYTDSTGFGGAEVALLTLVEGLDRNRWNSILLHHESPGIGPLLERASRIGVSARCVPRVRGPLDLLRLVREVRSLGAAVFHAHLPWALRCGSGLVAAALAGVPAVIASQQLFQGISSPRLLVRNWLIGLGVDRYIAVSDEMAGRLRATPSFASRKILVIRNSVDPHRLGGDAAGCARTNLGVTAGRRIVLTLARLDIQKGLPDLLDAAARVPEATFVVAGDGSERGRLEEIARRLGIEDRVLFLGQRADVPALLASCDLFVLPSLYEGLPISVLEAMAAGKPVVATAVGGTGEAVSDGVTGLLVPPGDPPALAAAIRSVLSDADLARKMGRAGRERALAEFSAEKMVREVSGLYENVLSGRSSAPGEA